VQWFLGIEVDCANQRKYYEQQIELRKYIQLLITIHR
jgi:hypothetical protein